MKCKLFFLIGIINLILCNSTFSNYDNDCSCYITIYDKYPELYPSIKKIRNIELIGQERYNKVMDVYNFLKTKNDYILLLNFLKYEALNKNYKNKYRAKIIIRIALTYSDLGDKDSTLTYLKNALHYVSKTNLPIKYELYLEISKLLSYRRHYAESLLYCDSACIEKVKDDKFNAELFNQKSIIYLKSKNYQLAEKFINSAIDLALKLKDSVILSENYTNKAKIFYTQKEYSSSHTYFKKAFSIALKLNKDYPYDFASNLAKSYITINRYRDAYELYKQLLVNIKNNKLNKEKASIYFNIATLHNKTGKLANALYCLDSCIKYAKIDKDYNLLKKAFKQKSIFYSNLSSFKKAYNNLCLHNLYKDSLQTMHKNFYIRNKKLYSSVPFTKIKKTSKKVFSIKIIPFLIIVCLLLLFIYLLYINYKKVKYSITKIDTKLKREEYTIKNLKTVIEDLEEGKKANSSEISRLLSIINETNTTVKKCLNYIKTVKIANKKEKETLISEFERLSAILRNSSITDVKNHNKYIELSAEIKKKLPDLTKKEEQLCILLKLNYSLKEISYFMNISPRSVDTSRYRLRKKLGFESNNDFINFLNT